MQIFKPLSISAALALSFVWASATAAQPANQPDLAFQPAPVQNNVIYSTVRKVYFFTTLDRDHNDKLSRSELPLDMHVLRRDFVRADFNEDRQLSPQEYVMYERGTAPEYVGASHSYTVIYSSPQARLRKSTITIP